MSFSVNSYREQCSITVFDRPRYILFSGPKDRNKHQVLITAHEGKNRLKHWRTIIIKWLAREMAPLDGIPFWWTPKRQRCCKSSQVACIYNYSSQKKKNALAVTNVVASTLWSQASKVSFSAGSSTSKTMSSRDEVWPTRSRFAPIQHRSENISPCKT